MSAQFKHVRCGEVGFLRQTAGLDERQRPRTDRGGIGIGNIIGANTPEREEKEEDTNGKEPVQIVHCTSHDC